MYIPDNYDIWASHENEIERKLERLPRCCCCDEPIQQETAVCINDDWFCDCCLTEYFRKPVDDYIE